MQDQRPDPKPKKNGGLWLAYSWNNKLNRERIGHILRVSSIEKGKSNLPIEVEEVIWLKLEETLLDLIDFTQELMIEHGRNVGPIWDWLTGIKGISDDKAAQVLALTDDIGKFDLISKYRRFAGLAVMENGKAEAHNEHFCRKLKSLMLGPKMIVDQFVRHCTPVYRDQFDAEKVRLKQLYPDPQCNKCDAVAGLKGQSWVCLNGCKIDSGFKVRHTPIHLDKMARRKVAQLFLSHLWLVWREYEGLPVTRPWILREGTGHTTFIEPPRVKELVVT